MNLDMENQNIINTDLARISKITQDVKKINYMSIKRILDVILASIGLVILIPIFVIIGIIIKIDSKGPVFFAHTRIGKNGKKFKMYKFRTMRENAQEMIDYFTEEQRQEWEENYKLREDPRITKVGNFLRKTSLDELPQVINIIKGDLSIVGPRPIIDRELEKYGKNKEKFLSITPGLTGYWQVNGRSDTTYEQRIEMELYYIDHVSPKLDIKIFFQTFSSVIRKKGAM